MLISSDYPTPQKFTIMGKVIFKKSQPVQSLSGTFAGAEFRTLRPGRTIVHVHNPRSLIDECVATIQANMADMRNAITQRLAIKKRVTRSYHKLRPRTDDDEQLKRWILHAYYGNRRKLPSRSKVPKRTLFTGANPEQTLLNPLPTQLSSIIKIKSL